MVPIKRCSEGSAKWRSLLVSRQAGPCEERRGHNYCVHKCLHLCKIYGMFSIDPGIHIPQTEFVFTFARSGGPGGQNVNKVNSKAILRWPVVASPSLPAGVRARFLDKYAGRITLEGEIILTSQKYRDQERNIGDCLEKLKEMIASVAVPPTIRRPTKPSYASKLRQADTKRDVARKKQQRRPPRLED